MESEELVRRVMAEVMAELGSGTRGATPAARAGTPANGRTATVTKEQYPLAEKAPERIASQTGRKLGDFSLERVLSGELSADDFRIAPETLELQAQVAESVGRDSLARNMRRAAELVAVPDDKLLEIYNALRPYRSTKAELYATADDMERTYGASVNAAFIREAADVYERRGRLKAD